jgi:hypothetical protein
VELPGIEPVSLRCIFAAQWQFRAIQSARKCVKRPGKTPNGVDAVNTHTERQHEPMTFANHTPDHSLTSPHPPTGPIPKKQLLYRATFHTISAVSPHLVHKFIHIPVDGKVTAIQIPWFWLEPIDAYHVDVPVHHDLLCLEGHTVTRKQYL